MTMRTTVDPAVPAQSAFILNAIRNVSGRVTAYDRATQHEIPVPGIAVIMRSLARECVTDKNGIYLFRDLRPGFYSLVVVYQGKESGTEVTLPDGPAFPKSVDLKVDSN
jgi:Carboxypeptidase regulatory-like domain